MVIVVTTLAWSRRTSRAVGALFVATPAGQPPVAHYAQVCVVCVAVEETASAAGLTKAVHELERIGEKRQGHACFDVSYPGLRRHGDSNNPTDTSRAVSGH